MKATREVILSAWADRDLEVGDAVIFQYYNGSAISPLGPHVTYGQTSGISQRYTHGVVAHGGKSGDLVTVRMALAGTIGVKVTWTGDLVPGAPVYGPAEAANAMSATDTGIRNRLGIYAGKDTLSDANSGQVCEVLITRVAPQYEE